MALKAYIRKERSKISDLSFHLKKLEKAAKKQKQGEEKIIKEIKSMKLKDSRSQLNKKLFLLKINKTDKPLSN